MEINRISNNVIYVNKAETGRPDAIPEPAKKDKIVISSEGRDLAKTDLSAKRIDEIRAKIDTKFYDSDQILSKVAEKIMGELSN